MIAVQGDLGVDAPEVLPFAAARSACRASSQPD